VVLRALSIVRWTLTVMVMSDVVVGPSVLLRVVVICQVLLPLSTPGDGLANVLVARVKLHQSLPGAASAMKAAVSSCRT